MSAASLRLGLLLLIGLLAALPARAQSQGDGSPYSRFGLGELDTFTSSQAEAMGGGSYALRSYNYLNAGNPALWSDQVYTRVTAGARYQNLRATNEAGETSRLTQGTVTALQFSLPLYTQKLGLVLSFRPYSRSSYRTLRAGTLQPDPSAPDSTVGYTVSSEGDGGLQQFTGGLGYRINDNLSVGASAEVIFGIVENRRSTRFDAAAYAPAIRSAGTRLLGVTGTLGGHLSLPRLLTEEDLLSIGVAFTLPTRLSGDRTFTLGQSLDRDTLRSTDGTVDVPLSARAGLAYQPDERWTLVADGLYEPWSNFGSSFQGDFALPGQGALGDRTRLSAGFEFLPAGIDLNEGYLRRMAFRLGLAYEQSYLRLGDGPNTTGDTPSSAINTWTASGGLSLPTILPGTRVDLNLKAGVRGAAEGILVRDTFYGVSLNVNIGERWFQERKLR